MRASSRSDPATSPRAGDLEARVRDRTRDLERAVRDLEAFNSAVSHDLRAPLRAIVGFSQLALEDDRLAPAQRENLENIRRSALRMNLTVEALLGLARLDRAPVRRETLDLSAMAEEVLEGLEVREPARCVAWTVEPGLAATGDPELARVALENLLANAWKFTGKRALARIHLGRTQRKGASWFVVHDNGAGFEVAAAPSLFEPFQRFHSQREFDGLGLGLTTVKRILANHGGAIEAEAAPDEGASFYFRFEARARAQGPAVSGPPSIQSLNTPGP
ncbi:MAG: hypothetical protein HYT80_08485 [Euryarchaeota archaeon]|nr:hypothetical protein [Euryarchaeota archaeon]